MKAHYSLVLALAGVAIGAAAAEGLKAQGNPSAYYIGEIDVTDEAGWKDFASRVEPTVKAFGGRYLARGDKIQAFDGEAPKRVAVIAFDSLARVQAWRASPAYTALKPLRDKSAKLRAYAVEGEAM